MRERAEKEQDCGSTETAGAALDEKAAAKSDDAPYTIYSRGEIWALVAIAALAGLLSPLPANIILPALPELAKQFDVTTAVINITVTVYLVFQGVSPMFYGPVSDKFGRRPAFLLCLSLLILANVGLAVTPTSMFALFLILRCIQAAGCAPTIALGAGVIGDISVPSDRGGLFGFFNLGPMLAPNVAPAVGGALSQHLGWRSTFWFLVIFAACSLLFIASFLPETLRALVGNGSVPPPTAVHRAFVPVVGRKGRARFANSPQELPPRRQFQNPFRLFLLVDVDVCLVFTSVVYAVNYAALATISTAYADKYPFLSETALGLCYLATGGGMILGSSITGKMLDWEFARISRSLTAGQDMPIERARLRTMPVYLGVFCASSIGWGWCLQASAPLAAPLVMQFFMGWTSIGILNTTMTLFLDMHPSGSSSITACTNLCRCSLAAVLVAVVDYSTSSIGFGWTYLILGGICALQAPLMLWVMRKGPDYRHARQDLNRLSQEESFP